MGGNDIYGRKRHLCGGLSTVCFRSSAGLMRARLVGGAIDVTYARKVMYAPRHLS
jgi:hypothetical protein